MASGQGFEDLLLQANRLTADMEVESEFPRVERNLFQIRDAAFKMATRTTPFGAEGTDIKASLLLGSHGYDVDKSSQKLESLSRAETFEPLEQIKEYDIEAFLKNEHRNALLAAIEHTRKNTLVEASRVHMCALEIEWEKEKQKILNSLVDLSDETFNFSLDQSLVHPAEKSVLFGSSRSNKFSSPSITNPKLTQKVANYSEEPTFYSGLIRQYNESIIAGDLKFSIVDTLKKQDEQNVQEIWSMLEILSGIPSSSTSRYSSNHRSSPSYQSSFVHRSLSHLEKSHLKYIERVVSMNLQHANRGGVPGTYNLIKSYFNIKYGGGGGRPLFVAAGGIGGGGGTMSYNSTEGEGLVEGHPVWAMVYYCLRSGDGGAVEQVVAKARHLIGDMADFLLEYNDDRRLSTASEREVRLQYKRAVASSSDPYKRLVYCLIGRCDYNNDHADVCTSTDDYLWLKLSQIVVVDYDGNDNNVNKDSLTLNQLQTLLFETYGEGHFGAHEQPLLYFRVLMLVGLFEAAIDFLYRFSAYRHIAVHVAIILYVNNLIILPHNVHASLLTRDQSDQPPTRRLNFIRLLSMYVSKFESQDPIRAVHYYYLIRDLTNAEGDDNLFVSSVCEVVIKTREFDLLLGQLQLDGTRRPGVLDKLNVDVIKVIEKVASELEDRGQLNDAVILYDLGMNRHKVIELLNKLLSEILSTSSAAKQQQQANLKRVALSIAKRYSKQVTPIPQLPTFHLLLDLLTFFECYHGNNFEDAYNVMKDLKLLPLSPDSLDDRLKNVSRMADEIKRCLPNVLLAMASIIAQLYKRLSSTVPNSKYGGGGGLVSNDPSTNNLQKQYKCEISCLVSFCGSLPYRMPSDVTARLVQYEASIL